MNEMTDDQICGIARSTQTAEPGRDGYVLPVAFGRAVLAAHRGKQDAEIARLKDAEEGAREAFEVVAQSKHEMLANEIKMHITIAKTHAILRERDAEIKQLRAAIDMAMTMKEKS